MTQDLLQVELSLSLSLCKKEMESLRAKSTILWRQHLQQQLKVQKEEGNLSVVKDIKNIIRWE
jgi:hypothetical protein